MTLAQRFERYWLSATREQRQSGAKWYSNARLAIAAMATRHGHSKPTVAGVVAATSPRTHWSRNLAVSDVLLAGGTPTGVFRASIDKARRIIAGAKPLCVLGGDKVRAFYRALMGDCSATVIDAWMVRAAGLPSETPLRGGLYQRLAGALLSLAKRLGVSVVNLQATIWVTIRGRA